MLTAATTTHLIRHRVRTGDDPLLAARLRAGDPDAFALAYHRHSRRLAFLIAAQLPSGCDDQVQDLAQDTFCAAIAAPAAFATSDVYGVLRTLALAACTRWRAQATPMVLFTDRAPAHGGDGRDALPASHRNLRAAVAALAQPERRAIELLYLDGHPHAAVARLMRRPAATVTALRDRGLAQLREHLAGTGHNAIETVAQH